MTPLKQLFRQPVRLFAIFLLVGMASAFICLSAGVFASAKATLAQIEERYVTIGVPTTETADVATEYNGLTLHHEESVISQDMWAYMDQLAADGTVIKGAYQQKYISAYCPSIQSVTSGKEDGTYVPSLDSPYNRAIMIVRVTSVDKTNLPESTELALSRRVRPSCCTMATPCSVAARFSDDILLFLSSAHPLSGRGAQASAPRVFIPARRNILLLN